MKGNGYIIFWGCTIQARFSFMEKATRLVFERLGIDYRDVAGFTCCPEKALVGSMGEDLWLFTAARNLAVAEREGDTLITPCNGCYSVLKTVKAELHKDPKLTSKVNEMLAEEGLSYTGRVAVKVSADSFLKKVNIYRTKEFPISTDMIERCVACEACRDDCPVNINLGIDLHALMKRILEEPLDDVILSPDIWRCLECHTCVELCPQVFGMEKAIKELKRMAVEKGYEPHLVKKTIDSYMKTGKIGEPSKAQRKKLGLPDVPENEVEGWKRLIKKLEVKSEK